MVKNHSRKIKKRCGSKYHLGGDISVIPPGIVPQTLPKFESAKPVDHILSPIKHSVVPSTKHSDVPPTKHSELQFQFTRHVMSCNNLDEGKWYTRGKDFEPGATAYGIEKTIEYAKDSKQTPYFNFDHVYVSNLYRTWITAVLLYGTNLQSSDTLNLYISPYLKEYHMKTFKRGNFPKEINHMANKFLKFLNTLKTLHDNEKSIGGNYPKDRGYEGTPLESKSGNWDKKFAEKQKEDAEFYRNLPNNIILHLPPTQNSPETQNITYQKTGVQEYKVQSFCKIQDTAGPNSGHEFIETGDLQKFMKWYNNKSSNYYKQHNDVNKVHIVTHSHIMREYLADFEINANDSNKPELLRAMNNAKKNKIKVYLRYIINQGETPLKFDLDLLQYYDYDGDKNAGPIYPIRNSNCWHFITTENKELKNKSVDGAITEFDLHAGVPIIKKMAKDMEDNTPNSLCGKEGSVGPMNTTCSVGGRKTRKRNIRRTKKHDKRKNNKSRKYHK